MSASTTTTTTTAGVRNQSSFPMSEATVKALAAHAGLSVLAQTPQLIALHTIIRDRKASREDFIFYSDRLIRLLVEEGSFHIVEEDVLSMTWPIVETFFFLSFCDIA
jgi:uracil phosphoribosyltransferase